MRIMSNRERAEARELYERDPGLSVETLANRYEVSRSQMLRCLSGITRPRGGVVKARLTVEQMRKMADAGLTYTEIGRQAGLTKSGVSRALRRREQERAG